MSIARAIAAITAVLEAFDRLGASFQLSAFSFPALDGATGAK